MGQTCLHHLSFEKGMANKEVAAKYDVPKNTLSTWMKNKHKNKW